MSGRSAVLMCLLAVLCVCAGCCAGVPMASLELDSTAKQFTPDSQRATIYIVRPSEIATDYLTVIPIVDGRIAGELASGTYLVVLAEPGGHSVSALSTQPSDSVGILTEAGGLYFVLVKLAWARPGDSVAVEKMPEADGRERVLKCKRAAALNESPGSGQ
jgi:hypothetical protein